MFEIAGEVVTVTCQPSPSGAGVIAPDLLPITPTSPTPLRSKAAERLGANVNPEHRTVVRTRGTGVSLIPSNGVPLPPFRGFVTRVGGGACRCSGPLQPTFEPLRKEPARAASLAVRAALPGAFDTRSNAVVKPSMSVNLPAFRSTHIGARQ